MTGNHAPVTLVGSKVSVLQDPDSPVAVGGEPVEVLAVEHGMVCVWDTEVVPGGQAVWIPLARLQGLAVEQAAPARRGIPMPEPTQEEIDDAPGMPPEFYYRRSAGFGSNARLEPVNGHDSR